MTKTAQRKTGQSSVADRRRGTQIRNWVIVGAVVIVVGLAVWYVADQTIKGEQDKVRPDPNPAEQTIPDEGRGHVEPGSPVSYQHYPPSSGAHYGQTVPAFGFYEQTWPEGYWVHNLEHGDIVVLYNCGPEGCPELTAKLKALFDKAPKRRCPQSKMLILPYLQGMTTPISVIAWGKQLDLAEYDEEAILNFYKRYEDRGPEFVGCQ
jgi:hypothetical protein